MRREFKSLLTCCRGGLIVEAALVLPFLILLGLGAADASYMMVQNHKLESRLTMAGNFLAKTGTPNLYESQARNLACAGQISTPSSCVLPNWSPSDIIVTYTDVANAEIEGGFEYRGDSPVKIVTVTSGIDYSGFGILSSFSGGSIRLQGSYQERVIGVSAT